jgi:hypothetical protein
MSLTVLPVSCVLKIDTICASEKFFFFIFLTIQVRKLSLNPNGLNLEESYTRFKNDDKDVFI